MGLTTKSIPNCLAICQIVGNTWFSSVPALSYSARADACLHCWMVFTPRLKWQLPKNLPSAPQFQKFANTQSLRMLCYSKGRGRQGALSLLFSICKTHHSLEVIYKQKKVQLSRSPSCILYSSPSGPYHSREIPMGTGRLSPSIGSI